MTVEKLLVGMLNMAAAMCIRRALRDHIGDTDAICTGAALWFVLVACQSAATLTARERK